MPGWQRAPAEGCLILHPRGFVLLLQPYKGAEHGLLCTCTAESPQRLSLQRKGSLIYSYTKDCSDPEGHVWPLTPAWMPLSHPHPMGLPNPLGSHCFSLLQQHHRRSLWFPSEGAGWSYRPNLLHEDLLYTRTVRQQSLNLEFLMEMEYLAVSSLASVHAQRQYSRSLPAGVPASLPLKSFPC